MRSISENRGYHSVSWEQGQGIGGSGPVFMLPGAHVTKDIPAIVEKAKKQHLDLEIAVADFVGSHPLMTEIVLDLIAKNI
jgi:hypothetical protein